MSKIATSIGLRVEGGYHHQTVFLRSESDELYSELVNVTVGKVLTRLAILVLKVTLVHKHLFHYAIGFCSAYDMAKYPCSCLREVGAAIGVMVCLVVVVIIAICVILVLYWWR